MILELIYYKSFPYLIHVNEKLLIMKFDRDLLNERDAQEEKERKIGNN
jgi:hypothetical protein